jgi:ABC-2 type transport system ATP-binding protein
MMSDRVVLLNNGYVVAEGGIQGVREEMDVEHPVQVLIRCDRPSVLASQIFQNSDVVEARVHDDRKGLFVKVRNPDQFYLSLNKVVADGGIEVESIAPVDDDLSAVYEYLIGPQ